MTTPTDPHAAIRAIVDQAIATAFALGDRAAVGVLQIQAARAQESADLRAKIDRLTSDIADIRAVAAARLLEIQELQELRASAARVQAAGETGGGGQG